MASGLDTCPKVVARSWVELFSASLLARSGLPDKITPELPSTVIGVAPLVMSPVENGSCDVVGLSMFSKGSSAFVVPC